MYLFGLPNYWGPLVAEISSPKSTFGPLVAFFNFTSRNHTLSPNQPKSAQCLPKRPEKGNNLWQFSPCETRPFAVPWRRVGEVFWGRVDPWLGPDCKGKWFAYSISPTLGSGIYGQWSRTCGMIVVDTCWYYLQHFWEMLLGSDRFQLPGSMMITSIPHWIFTATWRTLRIVSSKVIWNSASPDCFWNGANSHSQHAEYNRLQYSTA